MPAAYRQTAVAKASIKRSLGQSFYGDSMWQYANNFSHELAVSIGVKNPNMFPGFESG